MCKKVLDSVSEIKWPDILVRVDSIGWKNPFDALMLFAFAVVVGVAQTAAVEDSLLQDSLLQVELAITLVATLAALGAIVVRILRWLPQNRHFNLLLDSRILASLPVFVFGIVAFREVLFTQARLRKPDLKVSRVFSSLDVDTADQPPGLSVSVVNAGREASGACMISLSWHATDSDALISGPELDLKGLAPFGQDGDNDTVTWEYLSGEVSDGTHQFYVMVDSRDAVRELDEANNRWQGERRVILELPRDVATPTEVAALITEQR